MARGTSGRRESRAASRLSSRAISSAVVAGSAPSDRPEPSLALQSAAARAMAPWHPGALPRGSVSAEAPDDAQYLVRHLIHRCLIARLDIEPKQWLGVGRTQVEPPVRARDRQPV